MNLSEPLGREPEIDFSAPVERKALHSRRVVCDGFERADGLFDIEAKLLDTRSHSMPTLDGTVRQPREPLHHMGLRVTIDGEMVIRHAEPLIECGPVPDCPGIAGAYRQLVGLKIGKGFSRAVRQLFAGREGCSHMNELLIPVATTAVQTIWAHDAVEWLAGGPEPAHMRDRETRPPMLDSCHGYRSDGILIRERWPKFYTGSAK